MFTLIGTLLIQRVLESTVERRLSLASLVLPLTSLSLDLLPFNLSTLLVQIQNAPDKNLDLLKAPKKNLEALKD
ncbi:hypothetical protein Tco_1108121 [Tanacetum coccineum]